MTEVDKINLSFNRFKSDLQVVAGLKDFTEIN